MSKFQPVDAATVRSKLRSLEPLIKKRMGELVIAAHRLVDLEYVVLEVAPESSFDGLPIYIATFDKAGCELETELGGSLLEGCEFLEPARRYPLGRHDWLGGDTTADYQLVLNEILSCIRTVWLQLPPTDSLPRVYVGAFPDHEFASETEQELINLRTGERELLRLTFME